MRLIQSVQEYQSVRAGLSYAIGNFDGFHLGHQALIKEARAQGDFGLITFEPHPRQFFSPKSPGFRLTRAEDKRALAEEMGACVYIELCFDAELSALCAEEFHKQVLTPLRPDTLFLGEDFRYAKGRAGDIHGLRKAGFAVKALAPVQDSKAEVYSSSRVRSAIDKADFSLVCKLLGRAWQLCGIVEQGDKIGQSLGFPTANLRLNDFLAPPVGIYACLVEVEGDKRAYLGAAYYGRRPTVDGQDKRFEVHLLDFEGNLYGKRLCAKMVRKVRGDQHFNSLEAMKEQIKKDCAQIRAVLAA